MTFISFTFLFFMALVFIVYYLPVFKENSKFQNIWLLIASYFFYGYTNWRIIPLLLCATVVFYLFGLWIKRKLDEGNEKSASRISALGVVIGVGVLLYFKYFNFFIQSFADLFTAIGLQVNIHTFKIIMPLGVSYFTFKLISYIIEVNRARVDACKDIVVFANYVSFFPTIVSGPIDRPDKFIPQLNTKRALTYEMGVNGVLLILCGLFKKMVIADNLAPYLADTWNNYSSLSGSVLLISSLLYVLQLYADFSGYSEMAIGVGKLLGFNVAKNFNYPFFATNIAEYWRRWHMSLTSWVTDYVFTPLNIKFRDLDKWGLFLAILINMVIIGLWHGANWTFALFGVYQALLYIPLIIRGKMNKKMKLKIGKSGLPSFVDFGKMVGMFFVVAFGLIIFRANDVKMAFDVIGTIFSAELFVMPTMPNVAKFVYFAIVLVFVLEWIQRDKEHIFSFIEEKKPWVVSLFIITVFVLSFFLRGGVSNEFIYMQF